MPTTNARKHVIPTGTEASFSRATIFTTFGNSIRDVVPVANTTERTSVVSALNTAGQGPTSARPLVIYRHDAPGLHRLEYTVDGTVFLPASGVLRFATKSAADTWATSNSGYLSVGDVCFVANVRHRWDGAAWRPRILGQVVRSTTATTFPSSGYTNVSTNTLWSASIANGIDAYNNGWTIPATGRYWVTYEIRATGSFLAGVAKNYTSGTPAIFGATTAPAVQGIAHSTVSAPYQFAAGDVLTLHLLAATGDPSWATSIGLFAVEWAGD